MHFRRPPPSALGLLLLCTAWIPSGSAQRLDDLPRYVPERPVSGTLRISSGKLYGEHLLKNWEAGFQKFHPDARCVYFYGKGSFIHSICARQSEMALMGREMTPGETVEFYRVYTADPLVLTTATGTFDALDKTMAMIVIVNRENPLSRVSIEQLDGIFGEQRDGGYEGQYWKTDRARGPEKNIRTWGQAGLTGEWADKPIHVLGYDILRNGFSFYFSQAVMNGGDKWNPALREFAFSITNGEMGIAGKSHLKGSAPMVEAVSGDRYSIGYCTVRDRDPIVKVLPIAPRGGGAYVEPTRETVLNRTYPLTRSIYWVVNREPGRPMDPRLREYLRFVFSREGQEEVLREGDYLPLTPEVVAAERRKLL